ncbi:MAG: hypothetical protein E7G55_15840, partial [Erysipelotrichaceae bacterium]|nr:hypothetical protein [Erysipelotrichaceae bacterium]
DEDQIPVYGNDVTHTFTGKRIKRGLYRSKNGILMNADINGASNIIRKVYPCMPKRERWSRYGERTSYVYLNTNKTV